MNRAMKLEINSKDITCVLAHFVVNGQHLSGVGDVRATALAVRGLQFVARGRASNFLELLRNVTRGVRDTVDQRPHSSGPSQQMCVHDTLMASHT